MDAEWVCDAERSGDAASRAVPGAGTSVVRGWISQIGRLAAGQTRLQLRHLPQPLVVVGRFAVEVPAPDSLTRYRVMAVATQGAQRFGTGEAAFRVNKSLMIEPALTGVGNVGDLLLAKGIVHNTSPYSGKFEIALTLDATTVFEEAGLAGENVKKRALLPRLTRTMKLKAAERVALAASWPNRDPYRRTTSSKQHAYFRYLVFLTSLLPFG